ncbi:MAG TPA: LAGLIDADG family homing endonuclease [Acidimicrobiales bacterium]|nr:LAGLIDADG family homing endonuclease [Acidimicrobiales bacterium]
MAIAPQRSEIGIRRHFTTEGVHPYDEVRWERRDARITNYRDGSVAFEQLGVEVPESWSVNATNILAQKYFRGTLGTPERESSLRQVADRVADTLTAWGIKDGYFVDDEEAQVFNHELKYLIIHQKAAFNSPVWFNIGVQGVPQQGSACQPYHSMVSTPEGLIPIGQLVEQDAVGTKIFDAHGITRIVATKHNGRKQVLRIHTKAGHQLDVTGDHLVWRASSASTGRFVPAADLAAGDQLHWHRTDGHGLSEHVHTSTEVAEAALAGWLQSDGFVGQYEGTNSSLTIEAMSVTEAEHRWVIAALDEVFPGVHRHERAVETLDPSLDCRRTRLYGQQLRDFVERWDLRTRGLAMTVPAKLFTEPLPVVRAYLRSIFQAEGYVSIKESGALIGMDMISEGVVRGVQALLSQFGIFSRVRFKADRRADRNGCWSLTIRTRGDRIAFANEIGFIDAAKEDKLLESIALPGLAANAVKTLEIARIEELGEMDVYDIQTESGEYLSSGLRVHNCFILSVEDTMDSILNWYVEEGVIFKGGSGAGVNLSRIRSSKELLKGGGTASGPVSFMRGADASAGTIKSGGKTRRAAKMVILDADHPDVEDFIWCKAIEERKARVLRDAGFDMDLDGADSHSTQYQNANNSVRVTDEFMEAVLDGRDWNLVARTDGSVIRTVPARDLFRQIAHSAWECADPGLQYDSTINRWHTAPNTGRINGSNPCSEYVHLDNSACNLASMNLLTFLDQSDEFDVEGFKAAVSVVFTGMEIIVGNADYPTESIAETTRAFRQLGIGYANLGALLMAQGLPYDSDAGRAWAGAITALLTGHAYATSARTAARMGPFAGFHENGEAMLNVLRMHQAEAARIDEELVPPELLSAAQESWDAAVELAEVYGVRNSQASVLAPTGCLVGGTLVSTGRGLVRLRSLGDPDGAQWQDLETEVATDEGPQQATKFYVNGSEAVVTVDTARGHRIKGTPTHRIKVVDPVSGEWVWRRFGELTEGDLVPLAMGSLLGEPQDVPLPPLADAYWTGEHHVSVPRQLTPALAELLGYFMGDGFLHSRGLRFCVTQSDFDVVERLELLSKECFGTAAKTTPKRGYVEVRIDSVRLALWWEACGFAKYPPTEGHRGKGYTAHVPDAVLHANDREVYGAFLRGLYEADGDTSAGYPHLKNTSLQMVRDAQTMLMALGIPTTLSVKDRAGENRWGTAPLASLRTLNVAYANAWLDAVGFMGDRKNAGVHIADPGLGQAARKDYVPLTRTLIDRLAPETDRLRTVLLMEHSRGRVSRRVAIELFDRTGDPELGHLLAFFYDTVGAVRLGADELTYDLSVPGNVTYVANGFVSHNTIGLLMDCDTTGVEPDLGLVKTKKLVGGGTMSIVNQTVPRALAKLGYGFEQVEDIVNYVNEHMSIVGAPHLAPEHMAVFACSMGDNTIHYLGHIRMMGAVQPFISGAISKTVNMPEDVSVEDVEQLHIDAWRLGLKAVAIYRDNCKVAQPLSTTKKESASVGGDTAPAGSDAEARDREIAARIAELEAALDSERLRAASPLVVGAVRERLPRKRNSKTFSFRVADCEGYVTVGEYEDGRPGEVFIKVSKQGSTLAGIMDAFSISLSLGLQHGVPLATFVRKFANMKFEPAGITDDPELRIATSLIDYIFRRLALDYLPEVERAELGILSTQERTQPTLPGVEEMATPSSGLVEDSLSAGLGAGAGYGVVAPTARPEQLDAPLCYNCGNTMQRAGSCYVCGSCGSTSGCS